MLLAGSNAAHNETVNQRKDVLFNNNILAILHMKANKSVHLQGEVLNVFPFSGFDCCPLSALLTVCNMQKAASILVENAPVFRFSIGKNLTNSVSNAMLAQLLQDLCKKIYQLQQLHKVNSASARPAASSFRMNHNSHCFQQSKNYLFSQLDADAKMAADLEKLCAVPIQVSGGNTWFLGGTFADVKQHWLDTWEVLLLEGTTPLNGYDLDSMGLTGSVTTKGRLHIHNPPSSSMLLKFFSSANTSMSAQASKWLTLAEGESAMNVMTALKILLISASFKPCTPLSS